MLHLRARWYSPYLNQFLSPDPIIPDYFKPQSLNKYSYVLNNPINFTDPAGLCPGCAVLQVVAETPGNDYVEDWQRFADKGVTYEMYLRGRRLFKQYAKDGELFLLDKLIAAGIEPGPVDVAKDRLQHASMFAQCYANQNMDIFLPPEAFHPTIERAFETGDEWKIINAYLIFMTIIGLSDHDELGLPGRGGPSVGGGGGFRGPKAKGFDWEHILDAHSPSGSIAQQRSTGTIFEGLTDDQIKARVKAAWKNRQKTGTQTDPVTGVKRIRYRGVDPESGQTVEMWHNTDTGIVETAYPIHSP